MSTGDPWALARFIEMLDAWIDREKPEADLRLMTTAWVLSRADDPYQGVRRAAGFDNLWWGPVPRTATPAGTVVTCAYWIFEADRVVRCDGFATLSLPT